MIFAVPLVLILIGVVVFVAMKAKSSTPDDADFLEAERLAEPSGPKVLSRAPIDPLPAFTPAAAPEATIVVDMGEDLPDPDPEPEPVAPRAEVAATPAPAPVEPAVEPMVKARIAPVTPATPTPAPRVSRDDDEDDVFSRFKVAGKPHLATTPVAESAVARAPEPEPVEEPVAEVAPEPEPAAAAEPEIVAEPVAEAEPEVDPEPEPEIEAEPAAAIEADVEPVVDEPVAVESEVEVDSKTDTDANADAASAPSPDAEVAPAAAVEDASESVIEPAPAPEPVIEPAAAEAELPVVATLQPEPETDPVDHVLKALISRAKSKQVGIAEVAAELVEQANLEDRDIDEVLADLVDRVEEEENVAAGDRLQELTLFNDSVPRRPGQLTDFDRLDKIAKKRVIIRVLCLLVAMQEDNRLTPSAPRSEAETRHWPLSRAVWPVPAPAKAEDDDKNLPGRRLTRSKK
jgi:hypothetical protein